MTPDQPSSKPPEGSPAVEREFNGPFYKHPLFAYVILTAILFIFVLVMSWLAWESGWIPNSNSV